MQPGHMIDLSNLLCRLAARTIGKETAQSEGVHPQTNAHKVV